MLETITLGVPLLGFPFWADQFTNCKLMVDEWKIGYRLREDSQVEDNELIVREDISRTIRKLFSDEGKGVKKFFEALKDCARTTMKRGGSSDKNIAIRKLFYDEGKEVKKNVEALKYCARTAVRRGGSLDKNIECFIEGLKNKHIGE